MSLVQKNYQEETEALSPEKEQRSREEEIIERVVEEWYEGKKEKEIPLSEEEALIREKIKEELAKLELTSNLEEEIQEKKERIEKIEAKNKVKHLLNLAREKGICFAVKVAKELKDPYILDIFHDILARNQLYKKYSF